MSIQKKGKPYIRLDVKDTGIGMEKHQLQQIFNRFYQADGSTTRKQEGTGIGLALVKELVELQKGQIWATSEAGEGTSFEIHLPVLQPEQAIPLVNECVAESLALPLATPAAMGSNRKKRLEILVIEDNEALREYIRHCLDESKYRILEASNGAEGIEKAQSTIPDLIISDVMMPKKDGLEVTQAIRKHIATSHIPLILLTAKAAMESRLEGLKRGADAYLTKPFSPQELAMRVQKLIEIRELLQQYYQGHKNGKEVCRLGQLKKEDEFIIRLRNYILQNLDESSLNGDSIGKHFGISRVHLHRKLKALTGLSISEFVKSIRLQKGMELLQEGKLNISEITYQIGFSSTSHFSRSFKKTYGKSPSKM